MSTGISLWFKLISIASFAALGAVPGLGVRLAAQSALYVKSGGDPWLLVREVRGNEPFVMKEGVMQRSLGREFVLKKVEEYYPVFVSVRDLRLNYSYSTATSLATRSNEALEVRGQFESSCRLARVFVVLDLKSEDNDEGLFIQEIGTLEAHQPVPLVARAPIMHRNGNAGRFRLHVFTDGREVLQSQIPFEIRERVLDRMVKRRIKGIGNAPPVPLLCPEPEYPASLAKSRVDGKVTIRTHIGTNGSIRDPVLESASQPAFGEAALAAVRMWRFLPRIENRRPVEAEVEIPITFAGSSARPGG